MYEKCSFNDWCVINKSNTISVCFLIFLKNSPIEKKKKKKKKKTGKQFRGKCVDRREAGKNPAGLRSLFSVVTRFCERFGAVSTHSVAESEFDRTEPNYTGRSPRRRRFDLKRFLFSLSLSSSFLFLFLETLSSREKNFRNRGANVTHLVAYLILSVSPRISLSFFSFFFSKCIVRVSS